MRNKYRLTDETIMYDGRTLHRIESLINFNDVEIGDKGGFVESEANLSHESYCWVYDDAKVFGNACVYELARVFNKAEVSGDAKVHGYAVIEGRAIIGRKAEIYDSVSVSGCAVVVGYAKVYGCSAIAGNACIKDNSVVYGDACIKGFVNVIGKARIHGYVTVKDCVTIGGNSHILGRGEIGGYAYIRDAIVSDIDDYIVFKNWWSNGRYFTWTKSNNMWSVGCFYGTGEELIAKAYKDSEISGREYERVVRYVESLTLPIKPAKRLNCIQRIICKLFNIK